MTEIPLIDIAPFLAGTDKAEVARKFDDACRKTGFLVVAGQGVSPDVIAAMHAVSKDYFALPFWEKMRFKMPADWTNDEWVSTLRRVANPPRNKVHLSKTSLLFFHQPNYDAVVECIPTCTSAENPTKHAPIKSGDHVTMKINKHRSDDGVVQAAK